MDEREEFTIITLENTEYKSSVTMKQGDLDIDQMFTLWKDCMGGMGYHMDRYELYHRDNDDE